MSDDDTNAPDQAATDQSPENVPAPVGTQHTAGVRTGMFGVHGTGDTSGFGGLTQAVDWPRPSQAPYGGWFDQVVQSLVTGTRAQGVESALGSVVVHRGELTLHVRREDLLVVARVLRDDPALRFEFCAGVNGVHYPDDTGRELHAVYHLLSMTYNRRVRVEVAAPDSDPHVPSLVAVYPTTDWHEREAFDMYGIVFDGHPSLTRILMPDDWPGHPQRKDYPLGGIPVEYKGGTVPPPDQRRSYN
ncbi:NADH-quinone oxidoreductase subunit C [Nocardioides bruguierae]|uniref:NADH-quinone oxidoreductase subunit C n=1 Tax=Nocardioides bruguierae TaxID=2945102 RepID=UPI0027DFC8CD|nr:NADH-quinone oxidoreductase subunit C [Nocardioides bruguierae]